MADGQVAVERGEGPVVEHVGHQAHVLDHGEVVAVGGRDARRLLAPVLEGVDPEVRQVRHGLPGAYTANTPQASRGLPTVGGVRRGRGGAVRIPMARPVPAGHPRGSRSHRGTSARAPTDTRAGDHRVGGGEHPRPDRGRTAGSKRASTAGASSVLALVGQPDGAGQQAQHRRRRPSPAAPRSARVTAPWRLASRSPSGPMHQRARAGTRARGSPSSSLEEDLAGRGVQQVVAAHHLVDPLSRRRRPPPPGCRPRRRRARRSTKSSTGASIGAEEPRRATATTAPSARSRVAARRPSASRRCRSAAVRSAHVPG